MNVTAPPVLRPEDFPEADPKLLETVSRGLRQLYDAVAAVPELGVIDDIHRLSEASGATVIEVRNPLASKPRHVSVNARRNDGAALTAVWSFEWVMSSDVIRLSLFGLPASVRMRFSVVVL